MAATETSLTLSYRTAGTVTLTGDDLSIEDVVRINPVSLDYRGQIAEGFEDHASMAPLGVRKTEELIEISRRMAALELTGATHAIDLRGGLLLGAGTGVACEHRARVRNRRP